MNNLMHFTLHEISEVYCGVLILFIIIYSCISSRYKAAQELKSLEEKGGPGVEG